MRAGNRWILTLIQGIVAIALGGWILISRDSALVALIYAAAIYVLLAGIIQTVRALINWGAKNSTTELALGLIGLIGGAVVLGLAYFTDTSTGTILTTLSAVLIVYGIIGLFSTAFARGGRPFEWQPVLVNGLMVLLGVLIFVDQSQEIDILLWAAFIFIVSGIAMIAYALMRRRGN